jgi:hypothetical protein
METKNILQRRGKPSLDAPLRFHTNQSGSASRRLTAYFPALTSPHFDIRARALRYVLQQSAAPDYIWLPLSVGFDMVSSVSLGVSTISTALALVASITASISVMALAAN